MSPVKTPLGILNHYWGYEDFRGSQKKIIDAVIEGQDVMALLPTGGGKSLCYQIPGMAMDGICIVISPLIALIQNQVDRLKQLGIKAIALTGGLPFDEVNALLDNCMYGNYKFLYLSPERLQQELVQTRIQQMNVNLIAVDEAHCISQWGHDFRPAYLECSKLREFLPDTPIIALTATATRQVTKDIIDNLEFVNPLLVKDSFARDNIAFKVLIKEDKAYYLHQLCAKVSTSAIVYVRTRRLAQELARFLNTKGSSAEFFHGGISQQDKKKKLNDWLTNKVTVMVATNAFGMGIDKPDVALVVHYQIPDCIENYFQEAGRAGRNGDLAQAVLITNQSDMNLVKSQFLSTLPDSDFIKLVYKKLNNYFQIAYGEGSETTFQFNFNEFSSVYTLQPLLVYNALRILDQHSVLSLSEAFYRKTTVQFIATNAIIFDYLDKNQKEAPIIQTILRTYGGIFEFETKINTLLIAKKTGVSEESVLKALEKLQKDDMVTYVASHNDLEITFLVPREDDNTINVFAREVKKRQRIKVDNVESMLHYIKNESLCRKRQLLTYFGEHSSDNCQICDVCIRKARTKDGADTSLTLKIVQFLEGKKCTSRELIEELGGQEYQILSVLQDLLEDEKIVINTKNEYEIRRN
ncbi:MAG: RecQ family ATP-dependent DNA helicase [Flavobacteriaceae bacterium]